MKEREKHTEGVSIIKLPEGESGVREGNITEARLEVLAEYYGKSMAERAACPYPDVRSLALAIGVSEATVRRAQTDKRVLAKVRERLDQEVLYLAVEARPVLREIIFNEREKADTRLKAIRTVEEMAGTLKKSGAPNVVTNIVNPVMETVESDESLRERVKEIARREGWLEEG